MNDPTSPPELISDLKDYAAILTEQSKHHYLKENGRRAELSQEYTAYGLPGWLLIIRHILWMGGNGSASESRLAAAKNAIPILWPDSHHQAAAREASLQIRVAQCLHGVWDTPEAYTDALTQLSHDQNLHLGSIFRIAKAFLPDFPILDEIHAELSLEEITLPLLFVGSTTGEGHPGKLTIRASPLKGRGVLIPDLAMSLIERNESWMEMESSVRSYLAHRKIWPESSNLDLEWHIHLVGSEAQPLFALGGGSAGAALALALCTVLDSESIFRSGFVSRLAISATISSDGVLGKVNGTEPKLNSLRNRFFPPVRAVALSQEGCILNAPDSPKERDPDVWQSVPLNHIKAAGDLPTGFILRNRVESFDLLNVGQTFEQLISRINAYQQSFYWEDNPYRGLDSFGLEHASIFFGREPETAELQELFERRETDESDGCAFVAVIGSSGSGKSSLARAGFAASLISPPPGARHNVDWHFVGLPPSQMADDFTLAIIDQMAFWKCVDSGNFDRIALAEELKADPEKFLSEALPQLTRKQSNASGKEPKLLLLIDQFEEICTIAHWKNNEPLVRSFLDFINQLSRSGYCRVLITVRSDYDSSVEALPGYSSLVDNRISNFVIRPPHEERLRAIITRPAEAAGAIFEAVRASPGTSLADRLLSAINQKANALPLLQFTLFELFEKCQNIVARNEPVLLSNIVYDEGIGGIEGAIGRHAERVYTSLMEELEPSELGNAFKTIFSRLIIAKDITDVESGGWTSVPRKKSELIDSKHERELFQKVLDAFDRARILETRDETCENNEATYLLRHDSIIPSWDRLKILAVENLKYQSTMKQISMMLRFYSKDNMKMEFIPQGAILSNAEILLKEAYYLLDQKSKKYIEQSVKRNSNQKRKRIALLSGALLVLSSLCLFSLYQWKVSNVLLKDKSIILKDKSDLADGLATANHKIEEALEDSKEQTKDLLAQRKITTGILTRISQKFHNLARRSEFDKAKLENAHHFITALEANPDNKEAYAQAMFDTVGINSPSWLVTKVIDAGKASSLSDHSEQIIFSHDSHNLLWIKERNPELEFSLGKRKDSLFCDLQDKGNKCKFVSSDKIHKQFTNLSSDFWEMNWFRKSTSIASDDTKLQIGSVGGEEELKGGNQLNKNQNNRDFKMTFRDRRGILRAGMLNKQDDKESRDEVLLFGATEENILDRITVSDHHEITSIKFNKENSRLIMLSRGDDSQSIEPEIEYPVQSGTADKIYPHEMHLFDLITGKCNVFKESNFGILAPSFDPINNTIVYFRKVTPFETEIVIRDFNNLKILRVLPMPKTVIEDGYWLWCDHKIIFSPDGRLMIPYIENSSLNIYKTNSWERVHSDDKAVIDCIPVFSKDALSIAFANRSCLRIISSVDWRVQFDDVYRGGLRAVDFSPDGKTLVAIYELMNQPQWHCIALLYRPHFDMRLRVHTGDRALISGVDESGLIHNIYSDGTIQIANNTPINLFSNLTDEDGLNILKLMFPKDELSEYTDLVYSPSSQTLACLDKNGMLCFIKLLKTGKIEFIRQTNLGHLDEIGYCSNGQTFWTKSKNNIIFYNSNNMKLIFESHVKDDAYANGLFGLSENGKFLVFVRNGRTHTTKIHMLNLTSNLEEIIIDLKEPLLGSLDGIHVSDNGNSILIRIANGELIAVSVQSWKDIKYTISRKINEYLKNGIFDLTGEFWIDEHGDILTFPRLREIGNLRVARNERTRVQTISREGWILCRVNAYNSEEHVYVYDVRYLSKSGLFKLGTTDSAKVRGLINHLKLQTGRGSQSEDSFPKSSRRVPDWRDEPGGLLSAREYLNIGRSFDDAGLFDYYEDNIKFQMSEKRIALWLYNDPEKISVIYGFENSQYSLLSNVGNCIMHSFDLTEIETAALTSPWHALSPLAQAIVIKYDSDAESAFKDESSQMRKRFLASLTVRRIKSLNRKLYSPTVIFDYGSWAARVMAEELGLRAEASEIADWAISIQTPDLQPHLKAEKSAYFEALDAVPPNVNQDEKQVPPAPIEKEMR